MRKPRAFSRTIHAVASRLLAVLLACGLPSCDHVYTLVTTFDQPVFDARAIIRNGAGSEVVVTAAGDGLFAGEMFVLTTQAGSGTSEEQARSRYKRAVNRRLATSPDALVVARFGPGPWCFVGEPALVRTFEGVIDVPPAETSGELSLCSGPPPPPRCAAGGTPELSVDPAAHAFGDVPLGVSGGWFSFTVSNAGTGFVCLASMVAGGRDAQDFQVDDSNCRPSDPEAARRLLGEGSLPSCTVRVRFVPTRPGPSEATLRVSSNDSQVLQEFRLAGNGLAGALAPLTPVCVPRVGDHYERTVTLTNTGPGTVTVRSAYVGDWYTRPTCSPSLPASIAADGTFSCVVRSSDDDPSAGALVIGSDGVRDDPTATVIEIPLIPQVTPSTCTP